MGVSKRKRDSDYQGWTSTSSATPVAGSSSNPILLDSPEKPTKKARAKKLKDPDAPEPEKRGASMRPAPEFLGVDLTHIFFVHSF
jgi:hypothetical protein